MPKGQLHVWVSAAACGAHTPETAVVGAWHRSLSGAPHRPGVRIWAEVIMKIFNHRYGPDTRQPEQKAGAKKQGPGSFWLCQELAAGLR